MSGTTSSYLSSCAVAPKEEEDLKARFEDWAKENDRTYRDEEEKAMRFQVFKNTIKWMESQPPHEFRKLNGFADRKEEEFCTGISSFDLDPDTIEHNKKLNEWLARNDKGLFFFCNYVHDALASLNHVWIYPVFLWMSNRTYCCWYRLFVALPCLRCQTGPYTHPIPN